MIIYTIKYKGANYWGNYRHSSEIEFNDGTTIYSDRYFFRLKDAKKYLNSLDYKDFYEIQRFTS